MDKAAKKASTVLQTGLALYRAAGKLSATKKHKDTKKGGGGLGEGQGLSPRCGTNCKILLRQVT